MDLICAERLGHTMQGVHDRQLTLDAQEGLTVVHSLEAYPTTMCSTVHLTIQGW